MAAVVPDASDLTCPACFVRRAKLVEAPSLIAWVWYFRCTVCGYLWTVPKEPEPARKSA